MRVNLVRSTLRRALVAVTVLTSLAVLPAATAGAADPLAEAEARVVAARRAANQAAAAFEAAQTRYYTLEGDIARARQEVERTRAEADAIAAVATARAVEAYKSGNGDIDTIMAGTDVLDAMRRSELLDRANAQGNDAVDRLGAITEDLQVMESALQEQLDEQERLVADLRETTEEMEAKVAAAERAEQELRERLERERRQREEIEAALRRARAKASSGGGGGGGGVLPRPANNTVISGFTCPVPGSSFGDSWGAPRSGGRRHQGVDMMAGYGTPIYAVVSGSVRHSTSGLGGNQIWLSGNDGNTYFYAHIQSYVGGPGAVSAGDQIATVGDTGNARGTPHLHFEIHPGGGAAVNPYPTVRAAC